MNSGFFTGLLVYVFFFHPIPHSFFPALAMVEHFLSQTIFPAHVYDHKMVDFFQRGVQLELKFLLTWAHNLELVKVVV